MASSFLPPSMLFALSLLAELGLAQQFQDFSLPYDSLGLSETCVQQLNTTVTSCSTVLGARTSFETSVDIFTEEELQVLCVPACKTDLLSLRNGISTACDPASDVMVFEDIAYPATYMVDKYLTTIDIGCYRDKATGQFCDLILGDLRNDSVLSDMCIDCILGVLQQQLQSPLGYSDEAAAEFSSVTESCQSPGYAYTTPPPYALNSSATATSTETPQPTAACQQKYTVQPGDTCQGIAAANNVSAYHLIYSNDLGLFCDRLISGTDICLPTFCLTHELFFGDTCDDLAAKFEVSVVQLIAWNPMFDVRCTNLDRWRGWPVCVGPPGGAIPPQPPLVPVPAPTNAAAGSTRDCAQWYTVVEGDDCSKIIPIGSSLTYPQFLFINKDVLPDCSNLWLGMAYCVNPITPVDLPASTTFTRPETTTTMITLPTTEVNPMAPGTLQSCTRYHNSVDISTLDPELFPPDEISVGPELNNCAFAAAVNGIPLDFLLLWNPSLTAENCLLASGFSYCVENGDTNTITVTFTVTDAVPPTETPTVSGGVTSTTTTSTGPPAPTQPGMIESCKKFHIVASGDGCWFISDKYGISLDDFYRWNPGVGSDCSTLWLDYAVCVGV